MKDLLTSSVFRNGLISLGAIVVALAVFQAGMFVGYHKAQFSYRWGEQYHRNFAGPREGFFRDMRDRRFIEPHGTFGQILSVDGASLIIKGKDDIERPVLLGNQTVIRRFEETIHADGLRVDEFVVIIGSPNADGAIDAKFVRVMPPPGEFTRPLPMNIR